MVVRPPLSAISEPEAQRPQLAVPGLETVEDVVQNPGAAGLGQELGPKADQATGRNRVVDPCPAGAVIDHLHKTPFAQGEKLRDDTEELLGHVD